MQRAFIFEESSRGIFSEHKRNPSPGYFALIEQQGRELEELNVHWYDYQYYWEEIQQQVGEIETFNKRLNPLDKPPEK